jgi:hypothetical protein
MTAIGTRVDLADLAGFEVEQADFDNEQLTLTHRCGWYEDIAPDSAGLSAVVGQALAHARGECLPPQPSAEPYVAPDPVVVADMYRAFDDLRRTGSAEMSPEAAALMEDLYGPIGWARQWLEQALTAFEHADVPPALAGPAIVLDMAGPTVEERTAALAPLVRQAADAELRAALRGEASIAMCLMPEPVPARQPHVEGPDCWCNPFAVGLDVLHLDDRVPPGHGWAFPHAQSRTSPDYLLPTRPDDDLKGLTP